MVADVFALETVQRESCGKVGLLVFFFALLFGFLAIWLTQFLDLMRRKDDRFPGRYDKPLWFIVLIAGNILGAIIYWYWKGGRSIRNLGRPDAGKQEQQGQ